MVGGDPFILTRFYEEHFCSPQFFGAQGMANTQDRWLSIHEICEHLGVSSDTVYKWIDKHGMPAHRMGRLWKFKKDQVDAWVEAGGAADKSDKPDTE